ncbi:CoA transferase [Nocardia jinanensis]|uniref:L-carnitine dehydratase n=1 Tax=Nocardia jinanensis TaxID=382504 RepID=A0A917VNE7_9NOCA|nr:CoA transferase [Nocardia jinanensis]GGK98441.1 putative L-carnitine dehydratase [Nocardia jinanensis]
MDVGARLVRDYEDGAGVGESAPADWPDPGQYLAATLPVWGLAAGSVQAFIAAADRYREAGGIAPIRHRLSPERIAASFSSDRLLRIDGAPVGGFADLSGFFPTFDGWVRTHANYPHHRARLLAALELPADAPREQAEAQIAMIRAEDMEELAAARGAIAVRVRDEAQWRATPQAPAAGAGPLVAVAAREDRRRYTLPVSGTPYQPLQGVRVLDLTRVIAGPVATRALALLGAEVLRVDPPLLPEIPWQYTDTCQGKYSTLLDLRSAGLSWEGLMDSADVLVTGYRPGALERLGLTGRPGLVHARVSAWGFTGPWAGRRGFDSIVQAATGIAVIEGASSVPAALPAQALDHASGYLLAAGIVDGLAARADDGRGRDVRVSLARTATWLLSERGRTPGHPAPAVPGPGTTVTHGRVVSAAPALAEFPDYPFPAPGYGRAEAGWAKKVVPENH